MRPIPPPDEDGRWVHVTCQADVLLELERCAVPHGVTTTHAQRLLELAGVWAPYTTLTKAMRRR